MGNNFHYGFGTRLTAVALTLLMMLSLSGFTLRDGGMGMGGPEIFDESYGGTPAPEDTAPPEGTPVPEGTLAPEASAVPEAAQTPAPETENGADMDTGEPEETPDPQNTPA